MASQVFEDTFEATISLLEALMPTPECPGGAYPLPVLRPTGLSEQRRFRAVVLENQYLRASIIPSLGGRILELLDKRTGHDVLSNTRELLPVRGGTRGVELPAGIQFQLAHCDRPNSMGPVSFLIDEPGQVEDHASVLIGETAIVSPVSFSVRYVLPPEAAQLRLEVRVFNRSFGPVDYDSGFSFGLVDATMGPGFALANGSGIAFRSEQPFLTASSRRDRVLLRRFGVLTELAPRQLDTWALSISPISGLDRVTAANEEAMGHLTLEAFTVGASRVHTDSKLLILTEDGQTFVAGADIYPERAVSIPLGNLTSPPSFFAIQDSAGREILRGDLSVKATATEAFVPSPARALDPAATDRELAGACYDVAIRHLAHSLLGRRALERREWSEAAYQFEQSLSFNAEDHLTWWAKSICARLAGENADEAPELLNAHFLAPLEPLLRAEAFLAQAGTESDEGNPLLGVFVNTPEAFVEVACQLIEHRLPDQASRWILESLRHSNLAMLHYLMAYILLEGTRMHAEAAQHVLTAHEAERLPLPWRDAELSALRRISERFPDDENVSGLIRMCHGASSSGSPPRVGSHP